MYGAARKVFVIGVEIYEAAHSNLWGYIVSTLEVHTPAACYIGEAVVDREIELPIDIEIAVQRDLRLAFRWCANGKAHKGYVK